ncbi:hypothetical protein B0H34DRAFT_344792 [Crassisporium funariophilum]|nr:hypothetical protein B0H34DRAFT_344792 [Crassisporium funariophilum]
MAGPFRTRRRLSFLTVTTRISMDRPSMVLAFPNEIQRPIFEQAARLDGRCAFRLATVARYVHAWVQPILYERVVIRDSHAASCLLRTIRLKAPGYFEPLVKSLTFGSSVTLSQAKPIFVECSRRIIIFTAVISAQDPHKFLSFIRSRHLRRLTLVYHQEVPVHRPTSISGYQILQDVLSSLTHLAVITSFNSSSHTGWPTLYSACMAQNIADASQVPPSIAFQRLTHFATCSHIWWTTADLSWYSPNLRYFAILEPSGSDRTVSSLNWDHASLVKAVRDTNDRRFVLLKGLGDPLADCWNVEECWKKSDFWTSVEKLVDEGYISDQSERW